MTWVSNPLGSGAFAGVPWVFKRERGGGGIGGGGALRRVTAAVSNLRRTEAGKEHTISLFASQCDAPAVPDDFDLFADPRDADRLPGRFDRDTRLRATVF